MAVFYVPTCDQIASCGPPSDWDLMFCICTDTLQTAGVCTSAVDHFTNINGDRTANIAGQYSTSGSNVSLITATPAPDITYGQGAPGWSNTTGVLDADSTDYAYGTIFQSGGQTSGFSLWNQPTSYITVSGFGLQVPLDATIVAILYGFSAPQIFYTFDPFHAVSDGSAFLWNVVTTCQGNNYYWRDPNSSQISAAGHDLGVGIPPSSPWPDNNFYRNGTVQDSTTVNITHNAAYYAFGQPGHNNGTSPRSAGFGKGTALNYFSNITSFQAVTPQRKSPLGQGVGRAGLYGDGVQPSTSFTLVDSLPQGWVGTDDFALGCNAHFYSSGFISPIYGEAEYHLGPLAKGGFPMTPTKTNWTPAEVNDPSFGVGISQGTAFSRAYSTGAEHIPFAVGGVAVAVYYVGGSIVGNPFANCTGVEFQ